MARTPRIDGSELLAAVAGGLLSFLEVFIGLFAMPFAGSGPMGFLRVLSVTLGFELPLYLIFFFVSRRLLMYACWAMYAVIHIEACIFIWTEHGYANGLLGIPKSLVAAIFDSEVFIGIAVALLATYLFREERRRLAGE